MAMPAHMSLTGVKQGKIEGSCDMKGREGTILVQEFSHEIAMPKDPQSGQPSGKRVHKPLTLCKYFDKSSPKLYKALASGEKFSEVLFKWFRINPSGQEEHYFTIKLEDAIIVNLTPYMHNCLDSTKEQFQHMENVSFTYRKIVWTWEPDGLSADDDWKVPTAA